MRWLNAVDESYLSEFRELFETHFSRFEARLAQQGAELRAEFRTDLATQIAALRSEVSERAAHTEKTLVRWMFGFWIGSWAALAGTLIALRQLGWLAGPP